MPIRAGFRFILWGCSYSGKIKGACCILRRIAANCRRLPPFFFIGCSCSKARPIPAACACFRGGFMRPAQCCSFLCGFARFFPRFNRISPNKSKLRKGLYSASCASCFLRASMPPSAASVAAVCVCSFLPAAGLLLPFLFQFRKGCFKV